MRAVIALITVVFIAACGANGEPERPTGDKTSVTVSGTARIGVSWEG